jgi:cation transport ATPase
VTILGLAMGTGTDVAIQAGDLTLVTNSLRPRRFAGSAEATRP